jgi:hypothetical protein
MTPSRLSDAITVPDSFGRDGATATAVWPVAADVRRFRGLLDQLLHAVEITHKHAAALQWRCQLKRVDLGRIVVVDAPRARTHATILLVAA